jgi:HrpA-like RNA helicase
LEHAIEQLKALGAVKGSGAELEITDMGRKMSNFPIEASYAKILISSAELSCRYDFF